MTAVETASDLRHARVFVSVLGDDGVRRRSLAGLQSAHGVLQRTVARELRLKHTPTLEFVYDDTADRAARVARLIDASEAASPERSGEAIAGDEASGRDRKAAGRGSTEAGGA